MHIFHLEIPFKNFGLPFRKFRFPKKFSVRGDKINLSIYIPSEIETTTASPRTASIKINLYLTYESRDTLKSFPLFITVKSITKINLKHSDKFEI